MKGLKYLFFFIVLFFCSTRVSSQNYTTLGQGVDYDVRCMFADTVSDLLYVGGSFINGGGIGARGIASWNGGTWDTLGRGIDNYPPDPGTSTSGIPLAMCRFNNELYVGGGFVQAGMVDAYCIARWDGTTWYSLPSTPNGSIISMIEYNSELYVCGIFDSVGSIPANSLAKWNGTDWSDVNALPNYDAPISGQNQIYAMAEYNGDLYVAGNFTGTSGYTRIVFWDGTQWQPLPNGGVLGGFAGVNTMAVYNNELYVGGLFYKSDGNAGNCIMKWDGTNWSDVGGGMGGNSYPQIWDLKVIQSDLYAVGVFTTAGGTPAEKIAKWNGTEWCGFGDSIYSSIGKIESFHDSIFVGGMFTINSDTVNSIAKWIGGNYIDTCGSLTGINDYSELVDKWSVYPNPTFNTLTVNLSTEDNGSVNIELYDLLGNLVLKQKEVADKSINNTYQLSLNSLAKGMYLLKVSMQNKLYSEKIIIQ